MELNRLKQLQEVFKNAIDITGAQLAVFSFLNESSNKFEVKIIEGISISKLQIAKKTIQKFIKDFDPLKFSFSSYFNTYLKKIIDEKTYLKANLYTATENVIPRAAFEAVLTTNNEIEVATFPLIINENVNGLISFVSKNKIEDKHLKAMGAFTNQIMLFNENINLNEKLIEEVKEKTNSLEQEKNNLEKNVQDRTLKLDNSRSALLYMLKDIEKTSKELSSSKEYMDNIIKSMIETLIVVSTKGIIQKVNKSTLELLGYKEEELIDKHFSLIFSKNDTVLVDTLIENLKENGFVSNIEKTYIRKDGLEIPVIFSGSVMKEADDVIHGIVCVASDITKRKEHERETLEQNKKIEKANEELKIALKKAEESDKLKTAFLQNMSHEIRTPLNGIVGFSQLLTSKDLPESSKLEIAKLVERSSYRLIELVNNILDIAKIETGQIKINNSAFMLNNFMKEVLDFFILFAKEKHITISCNNFLDDDESIIFLDKEKLHQILINLINNSIKFTKEGEIIFGYLIKDNNIEFYVKDTGIGIPEEIQEKIFERFVQADIALTRNYEGSGLGLAICKGLTELLGGTMWLKSELGKETIFYFTLPFNPANKDKEKTNLLFIDFEKISKTLKILVAEDDEVSFKFLYYLFLNSKHKLTRAFNGQEAVDLFKNKNEFDIVLMDFKMPVMSGYEATKIIKEKFPDVPIIGLTAYAFEEDRQKALKIGCDDFLQKPFKKEVLFEKIINLIS